MSSNQCNTCESLSFNFWYLVIVNRGLSACSYTLPIKACSQTCIPWTKLSTSIFCPSGETIQQQECLGGLIFALPSVPNRESIEKLCLPVPVPVERMHFVKCCTSSGKSVLFGGSGWYKGFIYLFVFFCSMTIRHR